MKHNRKRTALLILLILFLVLIAELLLRPKVFTQALSEQLYRLKQYPLAEKLLQHNAKKDKGIANTNLAKSLYQQGKLPDAETASEAGIQKNPSSNALYDRGNIAYKQEDYKKALEHYKKALLKNPNDSDLKANYELTLRKLENQPPPPPKQEPDKQKQEEIRNILGGLDNKESSDRKQNEKANNGAPHSKWW